MSNELISSLLKFRQEEVIEQAWSISKEELLIAFINACASFDVDKGPFGSFGAIGITGSILNCKYDIEDDELIKIFEEAAGIKITEIKK